MAMEMKKLQIRAGIEETSPIPLFAEADLCKDESFLDLKLSVIGIQSKNLLNRPKVFMGPFLITCLSEPHPLMWHNIVAQERGAPQSSGWPATGATKLAADTTQGVEASVKEIGANIPTGTA